MKKPDANDIGVGEYFGDARSVSCSSQRSAGRRRPATGEVENPKQIDTKVAKLFNNAAGLMQIFVLMSLKGAFAPRTPLGGQHSPTNPTRGTALAPRPPLVSP